MVEIRPRERLNSLEDFLASLGVFVLLVVLETDGRSVDEDGSGGGVDLDGVASDVGLEGQGLGAGDLLGEDGVGRGRAAVATDEGPAVAEADGVGHVVVGPHVGAVGDARAWESNPLL